MPEPVYIIFKPTIEAINDVLHMTNCQVEGIKGIPTTNKISFRPGRINLEFWANCSEIYPDVLLENLPELKLKTEMATYEIPRYNACFDGTINLDMTEQQHYDLRIGRITQATIDRKKCHYWRFLYPVNSNEWFLKIHALRYKDDLGSTHLQNLIIAELNGYKLNIFANKFGGINWMVIESTKAIMYNEMDQLVLSLIIAMGFVLGKRYGDFCFHVQSDCSTFAQIDGVEALALQRTKSCPFQILNNNLYSVERWLGQYDYQRYALDDLMKRKELGMRWSYNDEATITMDAFNKLALLCYNSNDMKLAASMLIDGSLLNIEYQKPFFFVALETITSSLLKKELMPLPPTMPQKRFAEEVVPVLLNALNSIPNLSADAARVFSRRIEQNLNIAPNANKLEACFPKYGYSLTDADRDAIKKRDKTFHGRLSNMEKSLKEQQNEMLSINLRLHKLCSILLLKAAGFSGQVLNNEVLFGIKEACERKESVYITI